MNRFLIIFLCCISSLSLAQDIDERCQLSSSLCELQINFELADTELNYVYKGIISSIKSGKLSNRTLVDASELKNSLLFSQRSWLKFKEENCDAFYTLHSGGSQRNEARLECEIEMTKERIKYLKSWY